LVLLRSPLSFKERVRVRMRFIGALEKPIPVPGLPLEGEGVEVR
jgi:hypothetical protein